MQQTHLKEEERKESRHKLAIDRTVFSFERTALSYMRTGLAFTVGGVSLVKFFERPIIHLIGWIIVVFSFYFYLFGVLKFKELGDFVRENKK